MTSRFYRLPSLNALATFEASARHRGLKSASAELNVTPGAISRQIKALEEELGVQLFQRSRSGLSLTSEGETLYSVLGSTFARIGEATETIRGRHRQRQATLACTHAFAKFWLMRRMTGFRRQYPEICVNHLISDESQGFRRAEVDLRIRYGAGAWPGETAVLLFRDTIYPVVSPEFAERHCECTQDDLSRLPLLHVDWVDPDWTSWDELLRRNGVAHSGLTGRRFSNFEIAIETCREGEGIAIGWHRLIGDLVEAGSLRRFTGLSMPTAGGYYLSWDAAANLSDPARALRDWIVALAENDGGAVPPD